MAKDTKTNAMRIVENAGVAYREHLYECDGFTDGVTVSRILGQDVEQVFKTLVAQGKSGGYCVFVIPVAEELDLKKAANAAGEKNVEMIHVKDINRVTGYIRGGCSPIGMKKHYPTFIDETAQLFDTILVSGGRIGTQMELAPDDLCRLAEAKYVDLTKN